MRKKPTRPNAPEKRCFLISGRWHWKPDRRLRAAFKGVALGENYAEAMREAKRLNRQAEEWLASDGAIKRPRPRREGPRTVGEIITAYRASLEWRQLRPRTQLCYGYELTRLEQEFGHDVAATLAPVRVKQWFKALAFDAPETARHVAARGRMIFNWAAGEELIPRANPFDALTIGQGAKRKVRLTPQDLRTLVAACDAAGRASIGTALVIGFACVQRITDVIALAPEHIRDGRLYFTQSKSSHVGKRGALTAGFQVDMALPGIVAQRLADAPPAGAPQGLLCAHDDTGEPWHEKTIARNFGRIRDALVDSDRKAYGHLAQAQLRDGRRSGFVQYVLDGASVPFVCSMSGHTIQEGMDIVEHYLPKTPDQADRAVALLSVRL
jgi:hypothetical protein